MLLEAYDAGNKNPGSVLRKSPSNLKQMKFRKQSDDQHHPVQSMQKKGSTTSKKKEQSPFGKNVKGSIMNASPYQQQFAYMKPLIGSPSAASKLLLTNQPTANSKTNEGTHDDYDLMDIQSPSKSKTKGRRSRRNSQEDSAKRANS